MFSWLKKLFGRKKAKNDNFLIEENFREFLEDDTKEEKVVCPKCFLSTNEKDNGINHENCNIYNKYVKKLENFDKNKPSILIIDDNNGIISFLLDDLNEIADDIHLENYNILTFDGPKAVYEFKATQHYYNGLNIKFAIIDLTFGGVFYAREGIIKATGVDVYIAIKHYEGDDFKFIFYTGNSLNDHVKSTKQMMEKFKEYSGGENLIDYTLFKTSISIDKRRELLKKWFLDKNYKKIKVDDV